MSQFHHKVNDEKSYRRAIFLAVSLALAGICSMYPVMCFKNYSTKEKEKLNSKVAQVERKAEQGEDPRAGSSSPSTSLLDEASRTARQSSPEVPRRRSRDVLNERQSSVQERARLRSGSGFGSPPTPPRSPTAETVPSQLLGGRVGSDADILREDLPDSSESAQSTADYHTARKASTAVRLRNLLSPPRTARQELQTTAEQPDEEADSLPKTPSTANSSQSKTSKASSASNASSFAYLLRDHRADKRLLQKKNHPSAHLSKHTPPQPKPALPQRTPSYYKPKVVEDTLVHDAPSPTTSLLRPTAPLTVAEFIKVAEPSPARAPRPPPRSDSPARPVRPVRNLRSSDSRTSESISTTSLLTPPQFLTKRPAMARSPGPNDTSKPLPLPPQPRFSTTSRPDLKARESAKSSLARPKHLSLLLPLPSKVETVPGQKRYHSVTPPEAEPTTPTRAFFHHGDHYFRTFGNDAVYMKAFTPTMIPTQPQQPSPASLTPLSEPVRPVAPRLPSDNAVSAHHKRRRSSIFKLFRMTALTDSTYEAPRSGIVGTRPPPSPVTPGIAVSPPFEPEAKRRRSDHTSSDMSLPPYFAQPLRTRRSSNTTPSPLVSPRGRTTESPGPRPMFRQRPAYSQRSSGESPVSPMSLARQRPRMRHTATLADIADADIPAVVPGGEVIPAVPSGPVTGPRPKIKSLNGKEYYQAKRTGTGAVRWLQSEGRQVKTPPEKHPGAESQGKRRSTFKQFFVDLRHNASATSLKTEPETSEPATVGRRASLLPRGSSATLLAKASKPSLNKLKRKASQANADTARYHEWRERPELRVTDFQQTPYSQRVANTRRAELQQVKAYVEEALNDDDDDTVLGFELNVPDHLPSSPLCPLSLRHKSGGKAICPIHGRTKAQSPGSKKASASMASKNNGPRIVYEGVAEGAGRRSSQSAGLDGVQQHESVHERATEQTWYS